MKIISRIQLKQMCVRFFFFLNVYEILSSCHGIICTIVSLKWRTYCVEVSYIAFLKVAHLLCLSLNCQHVIILPRRGPEEWSKTFSV